jgi:predicted DNA-binding protein YlxM (UPF0122 family)
MEKLYQEIQDQINQLMTSKVAKHSDNRLLQYEKNSKITPDLINDALKMYSDGFTMKEIADKWNTNRGTILKIMKMKSVDTMKNNSVGLKKRKIHEEKKNDILNGMGVHEYCAKWNVQPNHFYDKKYRVKKNLVESKQ